LVPAGTVCQAVPSQYIISPLEGFVGNPLPPPGANCQLALPWASEVSTFPLPSVPSIIFTGPSTSNSCALSTEKGIKKRTSARE